MARITASKELVVIPTTWYVPSSISSKEFFMQRRMITTFEWKYPPKRDWPPTLTDIPVKYRVGKRMWDELGKFGLKLQITSTYLARSAWLEFIPPEEVLPGLLCSTEEIKKRILVLCRSGILKDSGTDQVHESLDRDQITFSYLINSPKGEQVGETALRTALEIFRVMGIDSKKCAPHFKLTQETEVLYKRDWVPYRKYLCTKFGLL
jgi:hypothetical protein